MTPPVAQNHALIPRQPRTQNTRGTCSIHMLERRSSLADIVNTAHPRKQPPSPAFAGNTVQRPTDRRRQVMIPNKFGHRGSIQKVLH